MAKKKPSPFDAFFASADGGNAAQAQMAFAQAGGQVNLDPNNFKGQTQQAFNQGGLSDFFKAADAAATGNQVGLTEVLNNPNQNAVSRVNQQGQSFNASDGTPPPPPGIVVPGGTEVPGGGEPDAGRDAFNAFRGRNAAQDAAASSAAPVARAVQPESPVLPLDPAVEAQQRARAQNLMDAMLANPDQAMNPDLFRAQLGWAVDDRIRNEFTDKFRAAGLAQQRERTNPIAAQDPTASLVNNGASFTEGIPLQATEITGPNANTSSGLSNAISGLVREGAALDLPSNDALRQNQTSTILELINQSDRAGREAVTGLSLPDITASSVPARTLSALEQATEQRALDRLTGGRFIDPNSALTDSAEGVVMDRLQGGDNPVLQQLRERNATAFEDNRKQDIAELNRFGVLRGGDNIEAMLDLRERQRLADLDVDALGFQMQDNALAQALGLQSRRDNLGLAEQDLQRAAISDASGLSNTRNALDLNEAQLTGNLRGAATLQSRLAQAGLQFDAANLQQNVADRTLARNLTATSPTQREVFEEGVRQNQFGEGLARNADQRAGQALQSDLFGEVSQGANRAPRQTLTGRGFEDNLSTSDLQRLLATNQDTRAGEAQDRTFGDSRIAQILAGAEAGLIAESTARTALIDALFGGGGGGLPGTLSQEDVVTGINDVQRNIQGSVQGRNATNTERAIQRILDGSYVPQGSMATEFDNVDRRESGRDLEAQQIIAELTRLNGGVDPVTIRDAGADQSVLQQIIDSQTGGGTFENDVSTGRVGLNSSEPSVGSSDGDDGERSILVDMGGSMYNVFPSDMIEAGYDPNNYNSRYNYILDTHMNQGNDPDDWIGRRNRREDLRNYNPQDTDYSPITPQTGELTAEENIIVQQLISQGQTQQEAVDNVLRIRDR